MGEQKSPRVILADVSSGSLQKAIDNVEMQGYINSEASSCFDFRLGDGIEILEKEEVDVVVIAGMGGILMTDILGADISKTKTIKKLILQPRNGQGKLRWWLLNNGFKITEEKLVREGKYICEILSVQVENQNSLVVGLPENDKAQLKRQSEQMKYELPESILTSNGALALEFARKKQKAEACILENMKKSISYDAEKTHHIEERIKYLQGLLSKYEKEGK